MPKRAHETTELDYTNSEIISIIKEIRAADNLTQKDRARIFRRKYPEFADRFSSLFDMACTDNFDIACLESMLKLRERIIASEMSVDDASKIVGQGLFEKYVKDKVNE